MKLQVPVEHQRMVAVLHEGPDKVPFLPYDNLILRGELEGDLRNKEMGFCVRCGTYWSEHPNVNVETSVNGNVVTTTYKTPLGVVFLECGILVANCQAQ